MDVLHARKEAPRGQESCLLCALVHPEHPEEAWPPHDTQYVTAE